MCLHGAGNEIEVASQAVGLGPVTQQLTISHHGLETILERTPMSLRADSELLGE